MNKAYVFNQFFSGLGASRALGKKGVFVVGLDTIHTPVGRFSKYVREFHKVTDPVKSERGFIENLINIGKSEKEKPFLLPTNDAWSIAISKNLEKIKKYFISYNPPYSVIEKIVDKYSFHKELRKIRVQTPFTYQINNLGDLKKIRKKLKYPLVIKPNSRMEVNMSTHEHKIYNSNRLITINKFDEFNNYKDLLVNYDFLIQQKIVGLSNNMYTVGVYADQHSELKGIFCGKKVRGFPAEYGNCYAGESHWVQQLVDNSSKVIKHLKYTGIAELEFKRNEKDGKYYLIEINPRAWSWVGITPYAGVNLPYIAYDNMINGSKKKYVMNKEKKILWLRKVDDRYNCKYKYDDINIDDFPKGIKAWKKSLKKYDAIVTAEGEKGDRLPEIYYRLTKLIK